MREPLYKRLDRLKQMRWLLPAILVGAYLKWLPSITRSLRYAPSTADAIARVVAPAVVLAAIALVMWALGWILIDRRRSFAQLADEFIERNQARPTARGEFPGTHEALSTGMMLTGTAGLAPRLYHVAASSIDACIVSSRHSARIVFTAGMADALTEPEQTAIFVNLLSTASAMSAEVATPPSDQLGLGWSPQAGPPAHNRDMCALLAMHDPNPILRALTRSAAGDLGEDMYASLLALTLRDSLSADDRRMLTGVASEEHVWAFLHPEAMPRLRFASWAGPPGFIERARLLVEVSGEEGMAVVQEDLPGSGGVTVVDVAACVASPQSAGGVSTPVGRRTSVALADTAAACPMCGASRQPGDESCWLCLVAFGLTTEPMRDAPGRAQSTSVAAEELAIPCSMPATPGSPHATRDGAPAPSAEKPRASLAWVVLVGLSGASVLAGTVVLEYLHVLGDQVRIALVVTLVAMIAGAGMAVGAAPIARYLAARGNGTALEDVRRRVRVVGIGTIVGAIVTAGVLLVGQCLSVGVLLVLGLLIKSAAEAGF